MKMEQTECSETSAYKIQTLGNYPEESIQHMIGMFKCRRMIWVGNVECVGCERSACRVFKEETEDLEVFGIVGMV